MEPIGGICLLSDRLKALRDKTGLSQEALADKIGMKRERYANYEQGRRLKQVEVMNKLADFHNVSVDYLFGRTEIPDPPEKLILLIKNVEVTQEKLDWEGLAKVVSRYTNVEK
jgi:transcriptional regulator with XRE-family HTH domain